MTEEAIGGNYVPSWNGNPLTFPRYETETDNYVESTKWSERYLCGPRLLRRLTGSTATACRGQPRGWLSKTDGADVLLRFLRGKLDRQPLPNVSHYLEEYFHKLRRRKGESMAEWCIRSHDSYQRLRLAMSRVLKTQTTSQEENPW